MADQKKIWEAEIGINYCFDSSHILIVNEHGRKDRDNFIIIYSEELCVAQELNCGLTRLRAEVKSHVA